MEKSQPERDQVVALLFQCAAQKYLDCAEYVPRSLTDEILAAVADKKPTGALDISLLLAVVQQVLVQPDGTVMLRLINQTIL